MHDARFMRVMQSLGDLRTHLDRFPNRQRMGLNPLVQAGSVDEVAGNVDEFALTPDFVDRDDVWMPHLCGGSRFTQKLFPFLPGQVLAPRNLERDDSIQFRVAGFPDFTEGPLPQAVEQPEMPQHLSRPEIPARLRILGQIETTPARRTGDVSGRIVVDHFNRIVTVRTANLQTTHNARFGSGQCRDASLDLFDELWKLLEVVVDVRRLARLTPVANSRDSNSLNNGVREVSGTETKYSVSSGR